MNCNKKTLEAVRKFLNFLVKNNGHDRIFEKVNITSAGNGQCVAEMVVEKEHSNKADTLHGGFTAAAVDIFSSLAMLTHPRIVENIETAPKNGVSVDIHVTYLNPAKIGDKIVIDAETVKIGRTLSFLKVTLFRKDDNVIIAQGSHTKFIG